MTIVITTTHFSTLHPLSAVRMTFKLLHGRFFKDPSILNNDIAYRMLVSHRSSSSFTAKSSSLDCDVHVGKSSIDIFHGNQETLAVLIERKMTFPLVIAF